MSKHSGFPDNCDESDVKAMAASILSVHHDEPVFKSEGYIVTIRFFVGGKLKQNSFGGTFGELCALSAGLVPNYGNPLPSQQLCS